MPPKPQGQLIVKKRKTDTVYAVRVPAGGRRHYVTLGRASEGMNRVRAEEEIANILADVRRGIWAPPAAPAALIVPVDVPTFHELASEWVGRRRHEVDARTVEHWVWALSNHLLPFFATLAPAEITVAAIERYKAAMLAQRDERQAAVAKWEASDPGKRGRRPEAPMSNGSINKTLKVLAQVLDDAVELGYMDTNPARGKRRLLKAGKPRRTWLELHEVNALLAAARRHRALVATMVLAGLRVGELCQLRWRDVDLAAGKLRVVDAKTAAGERVVDVSPDLLEELKTHRLDAVASGLDDLVFATSRGTMRDRSNILRDIVRPAVAAANVELAKAGRPPIEEITNHSLRRTFASLLYEAGASPAYVMGQMGHTDPALALEIYTKVVERKRDVGARMDALLRGADWAPSGTSVDEAAAALLVLETQNPA